MGPGSAEESLLSDVLFSGQVYSLYAQLGLFDAEDEDAYPEWETGEEAVVFGPKGVAVAVAPDREIEVTVGTGDPRAGRVKIGQGELKIGGEGLIVGHIVAASVEEIAFPAGRVFVAVYGNSSDPVQVTAVDFILTRATPHVRPPRL